MLMTFFSPLRSSFPRQVLTPASTFSPPMVNSGHGRNPKLTCLQGECDEFCQNVVALDAQSQARFEQDLTEFQAQFGNSLSAGGGGGGGSRVQTQSSSLFPNPSDNQRDNAVKTDESFKSNTNKNKENKNFLFFGNNQKNSNNNQPQFQPPNKN